MKDINTYDNWQRERQKVVNLSLDPENIRLEIDNQAQDAIIADLFVNEKAFDILKSIAQYGWLPDETPVVVKEGHKYLVIEGNRRVASLKAIANPKTLPREYQNKVSKLVEGLSPIVEIEVLVAPNRESTDRYLASKHTVNTRRPWSALRRAYFYYAQKEKGDTIESLIEKYPNTDIPKYIRMYEMHRVALSLDNISVATLKKVENKREFDISTLERLYNYKFAQEQLGIKFNPTTGEVTIPKSKEFKDAYARIIDDVVSKFITSRKRIDTEENAKDYLKDISKDKVPAKETIEAAKLKPRSTKSTKKDKLFPKTLVSTIENSPGIDRRLEELQRINYSDLKYASMDSLRSFLETTLKRYLGKIGQSPSTKGKFTFLEQALKKLKSVEENGGSAEIVQNVELLLQDKLLMDAVNHNPSFIPDEDKIKDLADRMIRLLEYIFEQYEKYKKYKNDQDKNT